jgi:hypothetical protein
LAKVTQIRGSLLIPGILLLVYIGAFAEKNAFPDLVVVLVFGALGWVMQKLDWPRPPLLLGLVLGPLMENRLFLATGNYGMAWLWRPGVLGLLAVILAGLLYPLFKAKRPGQNSATQPAIGSNTSPGSASQEALHTASGAIRLNWAALFSLLLVITLAWALWQSRRFGFRAGLFPWAIGFPLLALAIVQLVMDITGKRREHSVTSMVGTTPDLPPELMMRRTASICGWILGFFVAIWLLGFPLAVPLLTFLYLKVGAAEKWPLTLGLTAFAWGFFYGVFERLLHLPFPEGQVFVWFG